MKHSNIIYEMTTLQIISPNNKVVVEAPITKDAKVFRQLGGEHYVELSFNSDKPLPLTRGCSVHITSLSTFRFFLKDDATPEPIANVRGYKYVLKFYAVEHYMEACQIKWLTYDDSNAIVKRELTFSLTTSLKEYAQLIVNNMNDHLGISQWVVAEDMTDDKYTKDMQELSFDGVSCWKAIGNIANAFGVEWWVEHAKTNVVIHFGKCEAGDESIDIREGEIVNRFPAAKRGEDSNYGTRFYIYGGTQNIPAGYGGDYTNTATNHISEKRLKPRPTFDGGIIEYYDVVDVANGQPVIEKTIILDDVFPQADVAINSDDDISIEYRTINGEENVPIYLISVAKKPTLLGQLGIHFTSGALMGRSFGASYRQNKVNIDGEAVTLKQVEIASSIEGVAGSYQTVIPNEALKPKAGDTYILTGVELDDDAIKRAEVRLYDKGVALAKEYYADTNVYDCQVDPVYCINNKIDFALGTKVRLVGAQFGNDGRNSRIQGFEKALYNPYIATYNIGDNRVYTRYNVIKTDLLVAQAATKKQQEKKDNELKIQALWGSSEQDIKVLQNEIKNLKGNDNDNSDSVSIVGAKKYAESKAQLIVSKGVKGENGVLVPSDTAEDDTVIGSKRYAEKLTRESNRLMIGGQHAPKAGFGFRLIPSDEFKEKYNADTDEVELNNSDAPKYRGLLVFADSEYNPSYNANPAAFDNPSTVKQPLQMQLRQNDVLISDGTKWRKIANTTIEGESGDITKNKLVQLLTTVDANDNTFTPLPTKQNIDDLGGRIDKVERRVTIAVVTPTENKINN